MKKRISNSFAKLEKSVPSVRKIVSWYISRWKLSTMDEIENYKDCGIIHETMSNNSGL